MSPDSGNSQITRKQHFVPKFYLKRFLNLQNEVEVLDCDRKKIIAPSGTRGICYEEFFYGAVTGQQDDLSQDIEKDFQQTEYQLAQRLDLIIPKILNSEEITSSEKWTIALLMSMLWIRGPVMREQINTMTEEMMKEINSMHFDSNYSDKIFDNFDKSRGETTSPEMREKMRQVFVNKKYNLQFNNATHMRMFSDMDKYANLFHGKDWIIRISKSKKFVTSDNPLVEIVPKTKVFWGASFLMRRHFLTLSPEINIEARVPHHMIGKKFKRKTLYSKDDKLILALNMTMSGRAHQYAYATERQTLEEIINESKKQEEFFATPEGKKLKERLIDEGKDY